MSVQVIPQNIISSIDALLFPYGISFKRMLEVTRQPQVKELGIRSMTYKQCEKYSGISKYTIWRAAKAGKIKTHKISAGKHGKVLIDKESFDSWLEGLSKEATR